MSALASMAAPGPRCKAGQADLAIRQVKAAVSIPLMANGGVFGGGLREDLLHFTGADT